MTIRPSAAADADAISAVVVAAFGGRPDEARIVQGVRDEGAALVELVAEDGGEIVGFILFSRMTCDPPARVAGLGPLAVTPARQGQGIGSTLVRTGLRACAELGVRGAVVLGAPSFYGRFGFSRAAALPLRSPYSQADAFMAMALVDDGLRDVVGVEYPRAFA